MPTAIALQELLEAHVAFESEQWRGQALVKHVDEQARALWGWLDTVSLNQIIKVEQAQEVARRQLLESSLPGAPSEAMTELVRQILHLPLHNETRLHEVLDQTLYEEGVELAASMEQARTALIRGISDNPVYAALASELIYNGIRDYLSSDQTLFKRVPGLSSLFNAGADVINRNAPGLEAEVEKRVRAYIENNLAQTLRNSEQVLLEMLTADRIRALGGQVWNMIANRSLAVDEALNNDDVDALVSYGHRLWCQLRETEYMAELVDASMARLFDIYGDKNITQLFEGFGLDEDTFTEQMTTLLPPLFEAADTSGHLEAVIRRRLESFYESDAAARVLNQ